ncbi:ornithine cyclodeaminase/mu-crystallin family protein [Pseudooceanicola batsensis HTCC2597]|uniref:Ornithine cyclodeaminase/mu-crystallin family protein n=1 Tax=Pseudooceanicola batsensis (strain ATCC BAA-863 / DSM 15984 / KCTC 12145 / HTCC2597) TaxID=252305 RepID=A3TVT7_PSEBH|nr:ornithine cyclodeaminase [Pseudooceanicola batsensis]EAQ03733.1 ornithine cyclodeaminase/mu-crystallin family protein [Pseudooceanicola batsensis HTCC2597]
MSAPVISFDAGEAVLDWIALTDALAAGHDLPRAEVADSFLYRGGDTLLTRSAWIDGLGIAIKAATIFPGNPDRGHETVNGMMSLLSDTDGTLEAMIDFHLVTKWKTAADSLLAARRLARPDSARILIIGAGTVAQSLREAYGAVFPGAEFSIWNRTTSRAEHLASHHANTRAVTDLARAVGEADIVACATSGGVSVLRGEWLRPGQHVDLIGAFKPDMREADDETLKRARIFVDSRDTTLHHIGEIAIPLERGVISEDDILADYYQLSDFRRGPDEITLFKNGGGAHLDLMTARHILSAWQAAR